MIINGVEIRDLDPADAKEMSVYETAFSVASDKMSCIPSGCTRSEVITLQCNFIFEFFNTVFGDGTAKKVFGEAVNLRTCMNAIEAVVTSVNEADEKTAVQFRTQFNKFKNRKQSHNIKKQNKNYNQRYNKHR